MRIWICWAVKLENWSLGPHSMKLVLNEYEQRKTGHMRHETIQHFTRNHSHVLVLCLDNVKIFAVLFNKSWRSVEEYICQARWKMEENSFLFNCFDCSDNVNRWREVKKVHEKFYLFPVNSRIGTTFER